MRSEKQKLADERNGLKWRISGILCNIKNTSKSSALYSSERIALIRCHSILEKALADFKKYHPLRKE